MSYLRSFAPWIVFAVIPASQWKWGALFALVVSVAGVIRHTRNGMPLDAQIIEIGSAVYFAALTVLAFADPKTTSLHAYVPAMAAGALGLISGVSLLAGKPFTLGIAKQSVPPSVWSNPRFMHSNMVITSVWTAAMLTDSVILASLAHSVMFAKLLVQLAGFAIPMVFTVRYAHHVRAKEKAAAMASQGSAA